MVVLFSRWPAPHGADWLLAPQFSTVFSVKTPQAGPLDRPGYGPQPTATPRLLLSRAQGRVLTALGRSEQPVTMAALSTTTGLHANTLRDHLDALEHAGLVRRHTAAPQGPGRPRALYEVVAAGAAHVEYAGLATVLASTIRRTSDDPRVAATLAGSQWGQELAAAHGRPAQADGPGARREVVAVLDELGFAPDGDQDNSVVRLTRCPLLDTARRFPDVVCAVHLGIVQGALAEYGADPDAAELYPFSEPGACRLELDRLPSAPVR
jgi:predicted ArsR family transcriptional regulator